MHGATTLSLASILERQARLLPDRTAIVCHDVRLTYAELQALSGRVANALRARGIGRGSHVALSCPNTLSFPILYFGILRAGAVVVPLNVLLKPAEIAYHLRDSDAVAYFCFEGTPELPMAAMGKQAFDTVDGCRDFVVLTRVPGAAPPIEGAVGLEAFLEGHGPEAPLAPAAADDTAVILYTSGTTGQPKGAELTHLNLMMNAGMSGDLMLAGLRGRVDPPLVALVTLPLFHSFGQVCQLLMGVYNAMTMVLLPRFEPAAVLDTIEREGVTMWAAVPTMYWALLKCVQERGLDVSRAAASLQRCVSGGAPLPVEVIRGFEATFGVRVLEGYGLSETSPVATFNHVERASRPGTVGQPMMGVEVACVDEGGRPVAVGERGEVVVRGHNIMKGYYKRPAETADAIRDGWFHTGDIGVIDQDGYLAIVDRKKDMILRGGFNVYPREVEETLMTHPAVSLCAVVGVPDERLGEDVMAFVVRKAGAEVSGEEIVAWCRERMATYKAPRAVEFRDQLPMTSTGKVLKRELRR